MHSLYENEILVQGGARGPRGGMVSLRSDTVVRTPMPWLWQSQHTRRTALVFQGTEFGLTVVCGGTGIISGQGYTRSVSMPLSNVNTQALLYTSMGECPRQLRNSPPPAPDSSHFTGIRKQ